MIHPYMYVGVPAREKVAIMNSQNGAVFIKRHIIPAAISVFNDHYSSTYTQKDLKSGWRKRELVECRHACMYILRKKAHYDLKKIGREFGGRDHSTVIHACATFQNLLDTDKRYVKLLDRVIREIQILSIKSAEEVENIKNN